MKFFNIMTDPDLDDHYLFECRDKLIYVPKHEFNFLFEYDWFLGNMMKDLSTEIKTNMKNKLFMDKALQAFSKSLNEIDEIEIKDNTYTILVDDDKVLIETWVQSGNVNSKLVKERTIRANYLLGDYEISIEVIDDLDSKNILEHANLLYDSVIATHNK